MLCDAKFIKNLGKVTILDMGSVGNPNPWATYDNFKDCSQEICTIYCPQFCYTVLPPPPSDDDSKNPFSPLIIAIIGVLASGLLLVSYYIILSRYCRRRNDHNTSLETNGSHEDSAHDQWQNASNGLDESLIKTIKVCKYQKNDGFIEGSDCAVCLSEFQENESLRLLPKCSHAFHLPCIDTWLKSQSNCPLCRANVVILGHPSVPLEASTAINISPLEIHGGNDMTVVIMDDHEHCEQVAVNLGDEGALETMGRDDQESVEHFNRSISLGTVACQRHLLISDILKIEENDEDLGFECGESWRSIGSSKGVDEYESNSSAFMFMVHDQGKNSISPH